jgi:NADPH:quinone reductase
LRRGGFHVKAIEVRRNGGPEELVVAEVGDPVRSGSGLMVAVEAAGINYIDVYQRVGIYNLPKPYVPGFEGVGRVLETYPGSSFKAGDRVSWINVPGSYAEQAFVPATQAIRIPDKFTPEEALLFQTVTAQYLVKEYRTIRAGDWALVHAAAGGVGQILVQWLKHLGAIVIATASAPNKLETARKLGADHLVNYSEVNFADAVKEMTGGKGVQIAFDAVGKATLERTISCVAPRGTAVTYGSASGVPPAIEPGTLIAQAKRLAGASIFPHIADPQELQHRAQEVIDAIEAGWLVVATGRAYPLKDAARAHTDIESRKTEGKLYLTPA